MELGWLDSNPNSYFLCCCSAPKSCRILGDPMDFSTPGPLSFTISQSLLKFTSIELVMLFNHLIHSHPLLLLPSIFPSVSLFHMNWLFTSGGQSIGASALASVLLMTIQEWFLLWSTGSPWSPRDSQESPLAPQFESINYSMLSLLYDPTLTCVHDCIKNNLGIKNNIEQTCISWKNDSYVNDVVIGLTV